jgi:hypothetical protein
MLMAEAEIKAKPECTDMFAVATGLLFPDKLLYFHMSLIPAVWNVQTQGG